tara:strand:- start:2745 stop:3464 length:720 start_codon:yes stop_codon:yes gene_type:complete
MLMQTQRSDSIIFISAIIATIYIVSLGSSPWLWASLATHIIVASVFSAVIHRYYCHDAFKANGSLVFIFSLIPAAYFYTSPVHWRVMHSAHHVHSDTDLDPHVKGFKAYFVGGYKVTSTRFNRLAIGLLRENRQRILHKYFLAVGIVYGLTLLAINTNLFLYVYALPLFTIHLCNRLHKNYSHTNNKATDRWYLEFIAPMGGEWTHKDHHDIANKDKFSKRWYEFDPGYSIVWLLKKLS